MSTKMNQFSPNHTKKFRKQKFKLSKHLSRSTNLLQELKNLRRFQNQSLFKVYRLLNLSRERRPSRELHLLHNPRSPNHNNSPQRRHLFRLVVELLQDHHHHLQLAVLVPPELHHLHQHEVLLLDRLRQQEAKM